MRFWIVVVVHLCLLVACQPIDSQSSTTVPTTERIVYRSDGAVINIETLTGWHAYADEHHLILKEPQPLNRDAMTVTFWTPDLATVRDEQTLSEALQTIVTDLQRDFPGVVVGQPTTFKWADNDAGYYLYNRNNAITFVAVVYLPDDDEIIAMNIADLPPDLLPLNTVLPELLSSLRVNGIALAGDSIATLSQVIAVPSISAEAAMEASQQP